MVAQETRSSSSSSGRPSRPQTKSQQHKRKQSGGQQQQQQQHHHHHKKSKQQHEGAALPSEMSSNVIRKKIRDTERLLKRSNITAVQQQELSRKLKALQLELDRKKGDQVVLKYREKYRYLKFVERTKVLRRIKKLEKRLSVIDGTGAAGEAAVAVKEDSDADSDDDNADDGDDMDEEKEQKLRAELESFKLNLLYIEHFPGDMKYISLFPKSASAGGGEDDNESVSSDDDDEQEEEEEEKQDTTTTNSSKNHQKWSTSNKPLIWQAKIKANISEAITTGAIKQHGFSIRKRDIFGSSSSSNNVATKLDVGKAKHNKRSVAAVDQEISLEQHQTLSNQKDEFFL